MKPQDYPVIVEPLSAEDGGGWIGRAPDIPDCFSDGESPQEALANAYDAVSAWLSVAKLRGWTVPLPSRRAA